MLCPCLIPSICDIQLGAGWKGNHGHLTVPCSTAHPSPGIPDPYCFLPPSPHTSLSVSLHLPLPSPVMSSGPASPPSPGGHVVAAKTVSPGGTGGWVVWCSGGVPEPVQQSGQGATSEPALLPPGRLPVVPALPAPAPWQHHCLQSHTW